MTPEQIATVKSDSLLIKSIIRTCHKCGESYPEEFFILDKHSHGGRRNLCSECNKLKCRTFRKRHPENWFARYNDPDEKKKIFARSYVRMKVKRGTMKREDCELCGATEKITSHHENYDQPFNVNWLCRPCHDALHRDRKLSA
jgi:hypothetical protein